MLLHDLLDYRFGRPTDLTRVKEENGYLLPAITIFFCQPIRTDSKFLIGCPISQSRVNLHQCTFIISNFSHRSLLREHHSLAATVICSNSLKDQ